MYKNKELKSEINLRVILSDVLFYSLPENVNVYIPDANESEFSALNGRDKFNRWEKIKRYEGKPAEILVHLHWAVDFFGCTNLILTPEQPDYLKSDQEETN